MARLQLALNVSDLDAAVDFYRSLFGVEPAKVRPGYANFAVDEPPLKLVLNAPGNGAAGTINHLGIEVGSRRVRASERPLDHGPVEVEQRVARAEPKRLVGVADRLGVAAVHVELPGQRVGDEHALAAGVLGSRRAQACRQVDAVVGA